MKKPMRRLAWGLAATAVLIIFFGQAALEFGVVTIACSQFRASYNSQGYPAPVMDSLTWAVSFGGRMGRPALEELCVDDSITEEGRRQAKWVIRHIDDGTLQAHLTESVRGDNPNVSYKWEARLVHRWMLNSQ